MRLIYADYNPYTNSIDVNTFENYILRIAAFCGLSFLLAIKITSKLSNFILHQFGGLHKLWDAPQVADGSDMNVRTLLNIETGKTIPSLFYAMKLANFLNLPVDQLFEYKNADLPSNEGEDCHEK